MKRPAWAAAPGFSASWSSMELMHSAGNDMARASSEIVMGLMQEARVLSVSREQANSLPAALKMDGTHGT